MTFYDEIAGYYDMIQGTGARYHEDVQRMHSLFRDYRVKTVLDLACGTGSHLLELARLGYSCTGCDMSPRMLEMAGQKAAQAGLDIQWLEGDMCHYHQDRIYDAVLGLYSFTTLVEDRDFRQGLAGARQAVRDNGLFYFNLLNADFTGRDKIDNSSAGTPVSYLDAVVNRPDIRLVRINQAVFNGSVQDWTHIYLVDEGKGVRTIVGNQKLRYHHLDQVREELKQAHFDFKSVTYSDIQGMERWDMFILAQAN